jgi:hypothetical protein
MIENGKGDLVRAKVKQISEARMMRRRARALGLTLKSRDGTYHLTRHGAGPGGQLRRETVGDAGTLAEIGRDLAAFRELPAGRR